VQCVIHNVALSVVISQLIFNEYSYKSAPCDVIHYFFLHIEYFDERVLVYLIRRQCNMLQLLHVYGVHIVSKICGKMKVDVRNST
jgi:hypothetical protein